MGIAGGPYNSVSTTVLYTASIIIIIIINFDDKGMYL